jgi:hypothetical protein
LPRKEKAGAGVSGENSAEERLVMSDDLPNSEAEAAGMHTLLDSVIRTDICALRLLVFSNATDRSSQRIPKLRDPNQHPSFDIVEPSCSLI